MTCTTTTRRRTILPALLLAAREAEAEYRRVSDGYEWARSNGYEGTTERLWPECRAAYLAAIEADDRYQRARTEEEYPECEE